MGRKFSVPARVFSLVLVAAGQLSSFVQAEGDGSKLDRIASDASMSFAKRTEKLCDSARAGWPGNRTMKKVTNLAGPVYGDIAKASAGMADRLGYVVCFESKLDPREVTFAINYDAKAIFLPSQQERRVRQDEAGTIRSAQAAFVAALKTISKDTNGFSSSPRLSMVGEEVDDTLAGFTIPHLELMGAPDMSLPALKRLTPAPLKHGYIPDYKIQKLMEIYWI